MDFAMTAPEIGALLGITSRRVTQYRDDGMLPTIERGKFDAAFLLHLRKGEQRSSRLRTRPDRDTLVALGWLSGMDDKPSDDDLAAFGRVFERNGLTRDAALLAVGRAMQLVTR
ncbi:hypothetical protein QO239_03720 [Cupriavidus taiwanensis]|uniref:hypothetical protein n=1 Tax=Cupriavidus taiwanensis TaxID=164546 RepID=UPI002542344B|nr:hypothetical protein [Cupriavidus taiwanensis]MDK3021714.1 hypothetical protein [Cupriavidus taiwanensis]